MRLFERVKNWVSSLASVGGMPVPDDGRSSRDESLLARQNAFLAGFVNGEIAPGVNFETLNALACLRVHNPDFSQAVTNNVAMANTGHSVTIRAAGVRQGQAAIKRLLETAKRIYPNSLGVDGLLNDAIAQAATFGAFSREDVVDISGRRVATVELVPPQEIRFAPVAGQWQPYQQPRNGWLALERNQQSGTMPGYVALHPTTYRYYRLERTDNSPYGLPPFVAALGPLLDIQADMNGQLKRIVQKFGLFGMLSVALKEPPWDRSKQTFQEYQTTAQSYLAAARKAFEEGLTKSSLRNLIVTFREQEVKHTPTTGDARGANELWTLNEDQVFSGLKSMAFMFGRERHIPEIFADVLMAVLSAQAENFQALAQFGLERTYELDLALGGLQVDGVDLKFNPIKSRNMLVEAQTEEIRQRIDFLDAERGIYSPDEIAQRRGRDKAFDPTRLGGEGETAGAGQQAGLSALGAASAFTATFSFDRCARDYRFTPPRIEVASAGLAEDNLLDFWTGKKKVRARKRTS